MKDGRGGRTMAKFKPYYWMSFCFMLAGICFMLASFIGLIGKNHTMGSLLIVFGACGLVISSKSNKKVN